MKFKWDTLPNESGKKWFVCYGDTTRYERGFASLDSVDQWIESGLSSGKILWRQDYTFRMKGYKYDCKIVDRSGSEVTI